MSKLKTIKKFRMPKIDQKLGRFAGAVEWDNGSTEVQVGLLTRRVFKILSHLERRGKDYGARDALYKIIGRRCRLLNYFGRRYPIRYKKLIEKLGIGG